MFKDEDDLGPEAFPERKRTRVQKRRLKKNKDAFVEWWNDQAKIIRGFTDRMLDAGSLPRIFEKAQAGETYLTLVRKAFQRAEESIELRPSEGIWKYGHDVCWRWFRGDERLPLGYLPDERLDEELTCHPTRLSKNTMEVTATNAVSHLAREALEGTYGNVWGGMGEAWGFRKDQGRSRRTDHNGRLVKLNGKQEITAWPASEVRPVGLTPDLERRALIERALEAYRWRWRLPGDWTERFWDTDVLTAPSGIKNRAYWKCPVPCYGADVSAFAKIRMWWSDGCYPGERATTSTYRVIDLTLDPELGDWAYRPDPKNSGVQRLARARVSIDVERGMDGIVAAECRVDDRGREFRNGRWVIVVYGYHYLAIYGQLRWAAQRPEPRALPSAYTLDYVEKPANELSAICEPLEGPGRLLRSVWGEWRGGPHRVIEKKRRLVKGIGDDLDRLAVSAAIEAA